MIKAIIFDWGGVLIDDPKEDIFSYCAHHLKIKKSLFEKTFNKFLPDFQKGKIKEKELWDQYCKEIGIQKPRKPSLWGSAFRYAYHPKKEMFSLAFNLQNQGYKTCFLSNTELPSMKFFLEQKYDVFDATVFSCIEGTIKPEPEIYKIALKRLKVKPNQAVFIDDVKRFIGGAKKVDINTILFNNPNQVKKELIKLSIKINQKTIKLK